MPDVRILCAADLHLGRRPSRLPETRARDRIASASGWERLVEWAVAERVDAVLLAGDVIDERNRSFEAYGPLGRGVERLAEAGVAVVAVAGNHDHDTLPDVARELGGALVVLGVGGRWERRTLEDGEGRPRIHVDGWSFPRSHHPGDPLEGYAPALAGGVPVVGLVHADLDQAGSRYAPVSGAALRARPVDAWVLGHIHRPSLAEAPGAPPILYPGSLQALDPSEEGVHGAWLLEVGRGGRPRFERVPLSPARYATVEVDVEGTGDVGELQAQVRAALSEGLDTFAEEGGGALRIARCRIRLTGRTPLHGRVGEALTGVEELDLHSSAGVRLSVDSLPVVDTRPALDLADLARGSDAPAHLARLLLALEAPDGARAGTGGGEPDPDLVEAAAREAARAAGAAHYVEARLERVPTEPHDPALRDRLRRQATRLLDALIATREAGGGAARLPGGADR